MTTASSQNRKNPDFLKEIEDYDRKERLETFKRYYLSIVEKWRKDRPQFEESGDPMSFINYIARPDVLNMIDNKLEEIGVDPDLRETIDAIILGAEFLNEGGKDAPRFEIFFSDILDADPGDGDPKNEKNEPEHDKKDEEHKQLLSDYIKKTSRKNALDNLIFNINTNNQGYERVWSTGIDGLDKKLNGGFHSKRLIVLGAISSLGKTSLALQVADNIARSGKDVLIFSLEMDSDELLAKTLSREIYISSCGDMSKEKDRLTTQNILSGKIGSLGSQKRKMFDDALETTKQLNDHLFYYIGENDVDVDKIRDIVEIHRHARNVAPLVIVDYLQILRTSDDAMQRRLDKRLLTDDDVTKLKVLSRDLDIPVLVISAFNRESYLRGASSSSFKESSGIEYSSDILLGLQYTNMDYKKIYYTDTKGKKKQGYESKLNHEIRVRELFEKMDTSDVRPLELKILKNRTGQKGSVFLDFVAPYNYFKETGTDETKPKEYNEFIRSDYNPFDPGEDPDDIDTF